MATTDTSALLSDPTWFPLRYDGRNDNLHFIKLSREAHRDVPVLTDETILQQTERQIIPRSAVREKQFESAPLHFIMHSGLGGSTLLTRALDQRGQAMTISEPPILTDLMSVKLSGVSPSQFRAIAKDVLGLLARPFGQGESVIVKCGAVANGLGRDILAASAESKAICLYAPVKIFLASLSRRGAWGRIWGRQLFDTLTSARLTQLGFDARELFGQTDLQIGALAWLALHREMGLICDSAADKIGVIDSESLLSRVPQGVAAVARHFDLSIAAEAIAQYPVLQSHSKTGERFNASQRKEEMDAALELYREEIEMVSQWIVKVAQAQSIPMELKAPRLGELASA